MRCKAMKPVILTMSMLMIHSAAPGRSEAQYKGASGNVYHRPYLELTPQQRADVVENDMRTGVVPLAEEQKRRYGTTIIPASGVAAPAQGVMPTGSFPSVALSNPTAGWKPEPTIQELAGQASTKLDRAAKELKAGVDASKATIMEALSRHEKAPKINLVEESQRGNLFIKMLEDTVALGEVVARDKKTLDTVFAGHKLLGGEAAKQFRIAEKFFEQKASEETDEIAKALLGKSARWYAARAARCEVQASILIPVDIDTAMRQVERRTIACKHLLSFVKADPFLLKDQASSTSDLNAFFEAFASVGVVLDQWTSKLLEDLEPQEPAKDLRKSK